MMSQMELFFRKISEYRESHPDEVVLIHVIDNGYNFEIRVKNLYKMPFMQRVVLAKDYDLFSELSDQEKIKSDEFNYKLNVKFREECFYFFLRGLDNYENYYSKGLKSPERIVTDLWIRNIIEGNADAYGEFVPSIKQKFEAFKKEGLL